MDHRDLARVLPKRIKASTDGRTVTIELENEDGDLVEHDLPGKFDVCRTCEGRGSHVNPSVDAHGISAEEFDDDPGFAEEYRAGRYDVSCYECGGNRVVPAVDVDLCTDEQKSLLEELQSDIDADCAFAAECDAERRMGA